MMIMWTEMIMGLLLGLVLLALVFGAGVLASWAGHRIDPGRS